MHPAHRARRRRRRADAGRLGIRLRRLGIRFELPEGTDLRDRHVVFGADRLREVPVSQLLPPGDVAIHRLAERLALRGRRGDLGLEGAEIRASNGARGPARELSERARRGRDQRSSEDGDGANTERTGEAKVRGHGVSQDAPRTAARTMCRGLQGTIQEDVPEPEA
jgi:hypothetical protein